MTEAEEFHKIYELEVVAIPTHRDMIREDRCVISSSATDGQVQRLIDEIAEMQEAGRPASTAPSAVEKSEIPLVRCSAGVASSTRRSTRSSTRRNRGCSPSRPHRRITIATTWPAVVRTSCWRQPGRPRLGDPPQARSQPGRGRQGDYDAALTEAKLVTDEDHVMRVVAVGGLHIIGTERHDSRRIDNQLRGRAGRQGDPGIARFYLSLETT